MVTYLNNNVIELEIVRAKCYYNFYNIMLNVFKNNLDFSTFNNYSWRVNDGFIIKIRNFISEWIFVCIMIKNLCNNNDFCDQHVKDLQYQIYNNLKMAFKNVDNLKPLSEKISKIIINSFIEYYDIIKLVKINKDNKVKIKKNLADQFVLEYTSDFLKEDIPNDNYVKIENNTITMIFHSDPKYLDPEKYNINVVFATYFRYKYMFSDNQTLSYNYEIKDELNGIECFSTPFNKKYNYFCSAFPDLEKHLGSEGEFFSLIKKAISGKYTFPIKFLKINPVFIELVDLRMSEMLIQLLDGKVKYEIEIILPDWNNFRAKDILLRSKYLVNSTIYNKGKLHFKNYFSGLVIAPADIIIINLKN